MYYKLLNKNLITAALVSAISLGAAQNCDAQGVVSLVEDDTISDNADAVLFPPVNDTMEMDTELPNTLTNEAEVIPLANADMDTPSPVNAMTAPVAQPAPTASASAPMGPVPADTFTLGVENTLPEKSAAATPAASALPTTSQPAAKAEPAKLPETGKFGGAVLSRVDNDLFNQMSDIEKQTTLLTLELRREKLRNEIEAIKAQRDRALEEKLAAEEEKKRKEFEWQKEQEAKVLREQQLLREKEIELEKIKQKKVLNAYMNKMLEQNQKWISENAQIYKQMQQVEADRKSLAENFKAKMDTLSTMSNKAVQSANTAKSNHDRMLANLTAQNIQLKKRIESDALAAKTRQENALKNNDGSTPAGLPVSTSIDAKIVPVNIAKEYAIMEITGKGDQLVAKLINKDGESFLARKGTVLQTGHAIEDISQNYIQFDRNGLKDYLYTSSSAMTMEPENMEGTAVNNAQAAPKKMPLPKQKSTGISSNRGIPSLGTGMFVK